MTVLRSHSQLQDGTPSNQIRIVGVATDRPPPEYSFRTSPESGNRNDNVGWTEKTFWNVKYESNVELGSGVFGGGSSSGSKGPLRIERVQVPRHG